MHTAGYRDGLSTLVAVSFGRAMGELLSKERHLSHAVLAYSWEGLKVPEFTLRLMCKIFTDETPCCLIFTKATRSITEME